MKFKLILILFFAAPILFAQDMQSSPQRKQTKPKAIKMEAAPAPQSNPEQKDETPAAKTKTAAAQQKNLKPQPATKPQKQIIDENTPFEELPLKYKLAQTIFVSADTDRAQRLKDPIEKGLVGGVLIQWGNYSLAQTKQLVDKLQSWAKNSPTKIPLLISIDYEGGTVFTPVTLGLPYLPTNMMLAAAGNIEDTTTLFYIVAKELSSVGVHINFAPVIDVNINPSNPIIGVRSFGSNTELVGDLGVALINGLQRGGVMAVAKHFPGHGETTIDSHLDLPHLKLPEDQFRQIHLAPFNKALQAGVMGLMTAHIVYDFIDPKEPATFSDKIINGMLRGEMGFKGLVISDSLDMAGATKTRTITDAAGKALTNGVDILLTASNPATKTHSELMAKIGKEIPQKRVEEAAQKVYELKKQLGLFDSKEAAPELESHDDAFTYFADKITRSAVTVVRNEGQLIPLKNPAEAAGKKPKLCSIFFSPARFANQLPVFNKPFMTSGWEVQHFNAHMSPQEKDIKRAKACTDNADLIVIGSMQWADKPNRAQRNTINKLLQEFPDAVLLSMMSPYDIPFYTHAKTVLALYGINKLSVQAAADILLGNIEAQGKLPVNMKLEPTIKPAL